MNFMEIDGLELAQAAKFAWRFSIAVRLHMMSAAKGSEILYCMLAALTYGPDMMKIDPATFAANGVAGFRFSSFFELALALIA